MNWRDEMIYEQRQRSAWELLSTLIILAILTAVMIFVTSCAPRFSGVPGASVGLEARSEVRGQKSEVSQSGVRSQGSEIRALTTPAISTNAGIRLPSVDLPAGLNVFGTTIARRGDGLKAVVYTRNFGAQNAFQFFHTLGDLSEAGFSGMAALNEPVCEFAESSIVVADTVYGSGIKVCEYAVGDAVGDQSLVTSAATGSFIFGDGTTRAPAIRRLKNGGLVIAAYRHDYSATLEIAYRQSFNTPPPPPGMTNSPPLWIFGTFILEPSPSGEAPIQLTIAECPSATGGYFNIYFNRDGTHVIKRARFHVADNAIQLLDFDGTWASDATVNGIPRDGVMSPDMEFPFVASVTDFANNRILVSYAQSRMIYSEVQCDLVVTRPVVTADSGNQKAEIGVGPECIDRSTSPCPLLIDQSLLTSAATGAVIHCLYDFVDPSDCNYRWRWFSSDGQAIPLLDMEGNAVSSGWSHYLGYSCDGYILAKDNDSRTRLFKLPTEQAAPRLTITKDAGLPSRVILKWDADASWHLQSTTNFVDWLDLPGARSGDAFSADRTCLFRLKKQ